MLFTAKTNNQETTYEYMNEVNFGREHQDTFSLELDGSDSKLDAPSTEIWYSKKDSFKVAVQPGRDDGNISFVIYIPYKNSHITVEREVVSAEFTADEVTVTLVNGTTETFKNEDSYEFNIY